MAAHRKMIGTVDFSCPVTGKRLDISPVYEGEDPLGWQVTQRAERAIDVLRDPLNDRPGYCVHLAKRRFRPIGE